MTQLAIDLPHRAALGRADFLVSGCNAEAVAWIERWPAWPRAQRVVALVLHGPAQSGKSHLVRIWAERSAARIVDGSALGDSDAPQLAAAPAIAIDDADRASERALLHLYNCCGESGASLLLVGREPPARWPIALPDLASRLRALPTAAVAAPDDALLAGVLVKHFADRQVGVAPGVIEFLVRRMERSFAAAAALAAAIDRAALSAGRPIGIAIARRVLDEAAWRDADPPQSSDLGVT